MHNEETTLSYTFERTLFFTALKISMATCLLLLIPELFIAGNYVDSSVEFAGFLFFLLLYRSSKKQFSIHKGTLLFIIILFGMIDVAWFTNGGFTPALSLIYVLAVLISNVLIQAAYRLPLILFYSINFALLIMLEFTTQTFGRTPNPEEFTLIYKAVYFSISILVSTFIITFLKSHYDRTRELNIEQVRDLRTQHDLIEVQNSKINQVNKNLEALVRERTTQLNKEKNKLIQYAFFNSHKVRVPVANILGISELLLSTKLNDEEYTQLVELLHEESLLLDNEIRSVQKLIEEVNPPPVSPK